MTPVVQFLRQQPSLTERLIERNPQKLTSVLRLMRQNPSLNQVNSLLQGGHRAAFRASFPASRALPYGFRACFWQPLTSLRSRGP
jgi:hypothetical protein